MAHQQLTEEQAFAETKALLNVMGESMTKFVEKHGMKDGIPSACFVCAELLGCALAGIRPENRLDTLTKCLEVVASAMIAVGSKEGM